MFEFWEILVTSFPAHHENQYLNSRWTVNFLFRFQGPLFFKTITSNKAPVIYLVKHDLPSHVVSKKF